MVIAPSQVHMQVEELLSADRPDMKLSLAETVSVLRLCDSARQTAVDFGRYPFSTTPSWLGNHGRRRVPDRFPVPTTIAVRAA